MSRDLRCPSALGERLEALRDDIGMSFAELMDKVIRDSGERYGDDGFMLSNPADHHSKTAQDFSKPRGAW